MSAGARRPPLGRGLAALFGEAGGSVPSAGAATARVAPIEAIRPSPFQPRRHFTEAELEALAQSIREKGILQPLLVRPSPDAGSEYELVAGERRWRAAQRVGLHEVPVTVREVADSEALEIALVENLQREDLSPLDEAEAYSRLGRDFGRNQGAIAEAVGKSRSHVANMIRLLALPEPVRRQLEEGALTMGHARALLGAADPAGLAAEVVRRGLNVRATELLVRRRGGTPPVRTPRQRDADTVVLERELGAHLGLRVSLSARARGGTLSVHYASLDQLDRVVSILRKG
ncbi:MAG TPA: ParB/RepB/Spo0J family partition protein [Stellaceae bacterium]|nr:ParB/RepB/Spo0J family partition protein [Stellaceae bacterium]